MQQIKAIETEYNGYRFRSRLEARWAVFFDAMGIEYQYEAEGYQYCEDENGRYQYTWLPDFVLTSENNLLVEVKGGDERLKDDWDKISAAVDFDTTPAGDGLLILGDIPNPSGIGWGSIPIFSYLKCSKGIDCDYAAFIEPLNRYWAKDKIIYGIGNIKARVFSCSYKTDYSAWGCEMPENVTTKQRFFDKQELTSWDFDKLKTAYTLARQARFEHGETPKIKSVFGDGE